MPSASKRWIVAFGSGSTPRLPEEPTPTNSAPVFGSIARWRFWWPCTMPNTPFWVIIFAPYAPATGLRSSGGTGRRAALSLRPARSAPRMCGTLQMPSWSATSTSPSPGEAVRPVEVSTWRSIQTAWPCRRRATASDSRSFARRPKRRRSAAPAAAVDCQAGRERRRREARRHLRRLPGIGHDSGRLATTGPVRGGGMSSGLTVNLRPSSWSGSDAGSAGAAAACEACCAWADPRSSKGATRPAASMIAAAARARRVRQRVTAIFLKRPAIASSRVVTPAETDILHGPCPSRPGPMTRYVHSSIASMLARFPWCERRRRPSTVRDPKAI